MLGTGHDGGLVGAGDALVGDGILIDPEVEGVAETARLSRIEAMKQLLE